MKKKVLVFAPFFTPSVKGGGPIISTKNLIENLSEKIDFYVLTSDRDLGDSLPFSDITRNTWTKIGNAQVMYVNPKTITVNRLSGIMASMPFDFFYLNSFFDFRFSILPMLTKKKYKEIKGQLVVAPRGEFSPGALQLKAMKKNVYIKIYKQLKIHDSIIWHATAESEKKDITAVFGNNLTIRVANNLTANYSDLIYEKDIVKKAKTANFIFISRITTKKNLHQALEFLSRVEGNVHFSVYGPIEDVEYWKKCQKIIESFPPTIKVEYKGILTHEEIIPTFKKHHFFLFPTLGENYGHVISEALIGGCPVIISDQTPWRELENLQVGWDISLDQENEFVSTIQKCVNMDSENYNVLSRSAFEYGKAQANRVEDIESTYLLFQ
jgi:glycosyltransferase involved in cell wall biosynthesis